MNRRSLLKLIPSVAAGAALPGGLDALSTTTGETDPAIPAEAQKIIDSLSDAVARLEASRHAHEHQLIHYCVEHAVQKEMGHPLLVHYLKQHARVTDDCRVVIDLGDSYFECDHCDSTYLAPPPADAGCSNCGGKTFVEHGKELTVDEAVRALKADDRFAQIWPRRLTRIEQRGMEGAPAPESPGWRDRHSRLKRIRDRARDFRHDPNRGVFMTRDEAKDTRAYRLAREVAHQEAKHIVLVASLDEVPFGATVVRAGERHGVEHNFRRRRPLPG